MPKFYTVKETMQILRLSRLTVSLKIKAGKIPVVRLSESKRGWVLIPAEFIDGLVEKSMQAVQQGVN
jgi:predicted site-specific integrase-resolvase